MARIKYLLTKEINGRVIKYRVITYDKSTGALKLEGKTNFKTSLEKAIQAGYKLVKDS